jgi:hypothetical protein
VRRRQSTLSGRPRGSGSPVTHLDAFTHLDKRTMGELLDGLSSTLPSDAAGSTHCFYHYPARFSPAIARAVIQAFSRAGDVVLDPFMGGGTSIIEGITLGRTMLGVDINSLAHFVARVRTTPLSLRDERSLHRWAMTCAKTLACNSEPTTRAPVKNLPKTADLFLVGALRMSERLRSRKRRSFSRCVLLRLGQWALDCRDFSPRRERLASKLVDFTNSMILGLRDFVNRCEEAGIHGSAILQRRTLLCRNAIDVENDRCLRRVGIRPRLVFTSPPYPSVHVLYHRWQYRGRKETDAPYWIANLRDGRPGSYYTGGSRTPKGRRDYFSMITSAFASVRSLMDPDGVVVQLVGFSDASSQLPEYLRAMETAGFSEYRGLAEQLVRRVPNRKWYARLQGSVDASTEILLVHRPS